MKVVRISHESGHVLMDIVPDPHHKAPKHFPQFSDKPITHHSSSSPFSSHKLKKHSTDTFKNSDLMANTTTTNNNIPNNNNPNHKRESSDSSSQNLLTKKLKPNDSDIQSESSTILQNLDSTNPPQINEKEPSLSSTTFVMEADAAEDKGSRHTMEDAWVVLMDDAPHFNSPANLRCAHFAIYDGHRGRLAAEYAKKHLHTNVLAAGLPRELMDVKAAKRAILDGFRRTDESLLQESTSGGWQDGATAVCIWVLGRTVFVANIGDAKAVLARSNLSDESESRLEGPLKAVVLTREHKAIFPQERARIQKAGGSVTNGRLEGRLEVSRAFGDRQFKKVGVSAMPDVHSFDLTEREHFIILGCDGLWGVFGPGDAVEFVQSQLKEGLSVTAVSRRLVREAVRERRCKDNCTALVIVFKHT